MKLKIYIPDIDGTRSTSEYVPPLYPWMRNLSADEQQQKFGAWVKDITITNIISDCDIVLPSFYADYYVLNKKLSLLKKINEEAVANNKLTVCFTRGDAGITPPLQNFHLFRACGYVSNKRTNEFLYYNFFPDPLPLYYNNEPPLIAAKTPKPVIGFCGQGKATELKRITDISRSVYRKFLRVLQLSPFDDEPIISPVYRRSKMLDALEKSQLVETNFIRFTAYRGGAKSAEERIESNKMYYRNMKDSQYIFCYRGTGNFSVRLYETLAAYRIPVIVQSDNYLPFPNKINWNIFPIVKKNETDRIDEIVAAFHQQLSNDTFVQLQLQARKIWKEFISYKGFMQQFVSTYVSDRNNS